MIEGLNVISDDAKIGIIDILQKEIVGKLINDLKTGEIDTNHEVIKSYVPCIIHESYQIDFLRAVGLIHFKDDEKAQLIINDFCGLIKDMLIEGTELLQKD